MKISIFSNISSTRSLWAHIIRKFLLCLWLIWLVHWCVQQIIIEPLLCTDTVLGSRKTILSVPVEFIAWAAEDWTICVSSSAVLLSVLTKDTRKDVDFYEERRVETYLVTSLCYHALNISLHILSLSLFFSLSPFPYTSSLSLCFFVICFMINILCIPMTGCQPTLL